MLRLQLAINCHIFMHCFACQRITISFFSPFFFKCHSVTSFISLAAMLYIQKSPLAASISPHSDVHTHTHTHINSFVRIFLPGSNVLVDDCFCQSCCRERPVEMACHSRKSHWRENPNMTDTYTHMHAPIAHC